ncbi:MAG: molybdenum cofactor biosynthesis protein MoaE [Vulcanimicrobiaceae bacterium]
MFAIVDRPIEVDEVAGSVRTDACGAVVTFAGIVRERADDDRPVTGLSYEAYERMAVREFETIAGEARERFGPCEISIVHRVGDLGVGEIAVVVAVGAPHRGSAFDACEYAIDELKARAPIWKREHYIDGDAEWKENACGEREVRSER